MTRDVNDVMHRKRTRRILGDLKKSVELSLAVWRRRVTFASSQWPCGRCHTCWGGGRWKSQHRKIVPLSPYVEKPLSSKVIKSFVPELRSHKYFSCFGIPMFYVYMSYEHYMYVSHIRIIGMVQHRWNIKTNIFLTLLLLGSRLVSAYMIIVT